MGGDRHRRGVSARMSAPAVGFLDPLRPLALVSGSAQTVGSGFWIRSDRRFLPSGSAFLGALDAIGCVTEQKMRWIAAGTPSRAQNRSWHSPPAPK